MLFARQKQLLALLTALGGKEGKTDFQKLLFLYCQEHNDPSYEFVPYRFGGFSFTSYADKRRLSEQGLLAEDDQHWTITNQTNIDALVSPQIYDQMKRFAARYTTMRGDKLVAETYRRYPYYAVRSEISSRVLSNDQIALMAIEKARPSKGQPGICTIGYEGRSLENYLNQLLAHGVSLLCDVRRNPLSRKYGFSKGTLAKACEGVGLRYEHVPDLGIASDQRQSLETQADYDALFTQYERDNLPQQGKALQLIKNWVEAGEYVALTCFERLPQQCHRHCVGEALEHHFGMKYKSRHL